MKRAILVALALGCTLAFAALGVWQVERRAWKLDLIERVETRIHAPPAPAPPAAAWTRFDSRQEAYRRVRLSGRFLPNRDTFVQALTAKGAGYWLMSPLRTREGVVLINRGFVPERSSHTPPTGEVSVIGLLRASEPGGGFLRANDPIGDRWYSRDVAAIAQRRGLGQVAPFFVDAEGSANTDGAPIGGLTAVRFSNNHLLYALTWFGLAGLSGYGLFLLLPGKRRV